MDEKYVIIEKMEDVTANMSRLCVELIRLDLKLRQIVEPEEYEQVVPKYVQDLTDACDEIFGTTIAILRGEV